MLYAIMCVRNEQYHLPSFFNHIRKYVDGFIVLDDGSTDETLKILKNEPKVKKIIEKPVTQKLDWDEADNRKELLTETFNISEDKNNTWVLCCDPDERFEIGFLKKLKSYTDHKENIAYGVHFRELHNDKKHYRCDGIWDTKTKYILFPLDYNMDFQSTYTQRHHIHWIYSQLLSNMVMTDFNLYHLKMIKVEDRIKRAELYNKLDPAKQLQPVGYDYLFDNSGFELQKIPYSKKYDYKKIPKDLKKYKV